MMRGAYAKVLTAGLIVLAASPAFAQPPRERGGFGPPGGMTAPGAAALLRNDKVQEELKLTDDQKADLKKAADAVSDKYKADIAKARADMDREKMGELRKAENADQEKAAAGVLKPEQAKRLKQIEVQTAGLGAFSMDDVQTALKLTDAQKKDVKTAADDMQKDVQDLFKDAQGDREKMAGAFKKVQELRTESLDQIVKGLGDDQKKVWKDLTGDKFEVALGAGGFGAGGRGGAGGFGRRGVSGILESLKLTDEQKTKATDLVKANEEKTRQVLAQAREELLGQLKGVLNDDQYKQLKDELDRQGAGGQRGPGRNRPNPNQ